MTGQSLFVGRTLPIPRLGIDPTAELVHDRSDLARHRGRLAAADTAGEVYGALVDLFIATGPDQREVRRQLLDQHGHVVEPHQRDVLVEALDTGLDPGSPIPVCSESLFTAGVTSPRRLVLGTPVAEPVAEPVLEPVVALVPEPVVARVTQPTIDQAAESIDELVIEPIAEVLGEPAEAAHTAPTTASVPPAAGTPVDHPAPARMRVIAGWVAALAAAVAVLRGLRRRTR